MKTWRWWGTLVGSMVPVVIALLSANAAPVAGALPMRACDLLTLVDVTGLLGIGFTTRQDVALTGGPTMSNCAFHKSGGRVAISLQQINYDAAQYLQQEQAGSRSSGA